MKWLENIVKSAAKEVIDDIDFEFAASGGIGEDEKSDFTFNVPVNIQINGKELEPLTKEYKNKMVDLVTGGWLQKAIERYLGEQFKEQVLTVDEDAKKIIQGKIMGLSEFYHELLQFEFEAREGIEQETIDGDEPSQVG